LLFVGFFVGFLATEHSCAWPSTGLSRCPPNRVKSTATRTKPNGGQSLTEFTVPLLPKPQAATVKASFMVPFRFNPGATRGIVTNKRIECACSPS
jgi:hypothetical protein